MRTISSVVALSIASAASAQAPRELDLLLKPRMADTAMSHVGVRMVVRNVDVAARAPLLMMQMVAAGVNTAQYDASALTVTDAGGPVPLNETTEPKDPANNRYFRRWTAMRPVKGDLTVMYDGTPRRLPAGQWPGGPVMDMRAEDGGMNGRGGYFLVLPDDTVRHRIRVRWDLSGMPAGARGVWTHGEGDATKVLTPEKLAGSIFMAGPVKSYPAKADPTFNIYWLTQPSWNVAEVAPVIEKLYRYYGRLFEDTTHSMRVFMRRGGGRGGNGGSGAGGSFLMYSPSADQNPPPMNVPGLVAFLAHEVFHQFPEMFDDFDVGEPTYWWSEGMATYYSNLLAYRLGVKTLDQFLENWSGFLANYYADPNRLLSYKDITSGMFGGRIGLNLMYGKGHAFMMLLNARIREKSRGTRSLDDLAFPLIRAHRRGESYTRADFLAALDRELGPDGRALYEEFRAGGKLLDMPDNLIGPCFRRVAVTYRPFQLGFDAGPATSGDRRVIRNLVDESAAARAGVREGDEVVSTIELVALRADTSATLTLQLRRGEQPVTVTYTPRGGPLDGYRWVREPSVPESACKL